MMAELDGKSIIVTGASRGIGAEAARALSAAGAKVMLLARNAQAIAEKTSPKNLMLPPLLNARCPSDGGL